MTVIDRHALQRTVPAPYAPRSWTGACAAVRGMGTSPTRRPSRSSRSGCTRRPWSVRPGAACAASRSWSASRTARVRRTTRPRSCAGASSGKPRSCASSPSRWARAFVLVLLGYAVLRFRTSEQSLQQTFDRVLPAAQPLAKALDLNINNSPTIERIPSRWRRIRGRWRGSPSPCSPTPASRSRRASASGRSNGGGSTSRWWPRRCSFPFEVYELLQRVTVLRLGAFAGTWRW